MDFNDTPEEATFRTEARAWLAKNAPVKDENKAGNRRVGDEKELLAKAKAWQDKKAAAGYAKVTWPKEFGGLAGTPIQQVIYNQEEAKFDAPGGFFDIGLGMCIPTLMTYGPKDAQDRYVKPALHGKEIWCQLFSEPSAGSDVAGLKTRAVKDGDEWVVNGQKVWTSGAHYSDFGILLTRTNPDVPKHKGLTMFYIDMKSPGVTVKPIKQINGGANFNEVFFNDLRIPDSQRLGDVGDGWKVALTTLMHERLAVGGGAGGAGPDWKELLELAKQLELEEGPAIKNPTVREKIADTYVRSQGLKYTTYRTMTALSRGQQPGPEASIGKLVSAPKLQDVTSFGTDLQGMAGVIMDGAEAPMEAGFQQGYLASPGLRIAGGTDEIMRNIIAERVLGLPGDIRVDKDVAFKDAPTGR